MSRSHRLRLPTPVTVIAALLAAATGLVGLAVDAVHGSKAVTVLAGPRARAAATLDDEYWDCLTAQVKSLVTPGEAVSLNLPDNFDTALTDQVILTKAAAPVVNIVYLFGPTPPKAELSLRTDHGRGSCSGTVVVASTRAPDGHITTRIGHGASSPGQTAPPPPAL